MIGRKAEKITMKKLGGDLETGHLFFVNNSHYAGSFAVVIFYHFRSVDYTQNQSRFNF